MSTLKSVSRQLALVSSLVLAICPISYAADTGNWAGEFANKKYLNGQATFQLSIEQSGGAMQVTFDAAYADGHGPAPEAQGPAKVSGNTLTFKFDDNFSNSGSGTIVRLGDDIIVSITPMHIADSRCLVFYGKNMRLKRIGKK